MHILGLANGSLQGNSEILLKAALTAAQKEDPSLTVSWIHVPSVSIPRNPKPLEGQLDISLGTVDSVKAGNDHDSVPDDGEAILNAVLDADAIINSTPTYSHQPPGVIKALFHRIGGPYVDVDASFAELVRQGQAAGDPKFANMKFDPRLQKPRVAGFMGVAARGSVFLQPELMERTRQLGRNIVSQMGKHFEDAQYLGPKDEFSCPNCHLNKMELLGKDKSIGCITCSTRGKLVILPNQDIRLDWEENSIWSCITMKGKLKHSKEIGAWGLEEQQKLKSIEKEKQSWLDLHIPKVPLPSGSTSPNL